MRIFVKAKPKAKHESVQQIDDTHFVVAVKEPPVDDRANHAILRALAEYLEVPSSRLHILSGHRAKQKIIEIL